MRIGILTFSHSDNYGAMLQAYGLKTYLRSLNDQTFIIPYAPAYLIGRHWWIPYVPQSNKRNQLKLALKKSVRNLWIGPVFFRQRKMMKRFRRRYLTNGPKVFKKASSLHQLDLDCLVVGSDQIWNPDITLGLRKEFFGIFSSQKSHPVIAYAASIGSDSLADRYSKEMQKLLKNVDVLSLREKSSIPYISSLTKKPVTSVMDPVFLIDAHQWHGIETHPCRQPYLLVYGTENNPKLNDYIQILSKEKNLPIIQLRENRVTSLSPHFKWNEGAGPSEFLGYIQDAQYIVTNSFHATAFSILFHKQFLVFSHSSRNARLKDLLTNCGLEDRIFDGSLSIKQIDCPIDWDQVDQKKEKMIRHSKEFLKRSLAMYEAH